MTNRAGRPRNPAIDSALAIHTLRQLAAQGYAGLSLSGVAHIAGVSKATLYRRYKSKRALVSAALSTIAVQAPQPKDTGNFESDLLVFARETLRMLRDLNVFPILSALIVQAEQDPRPLKLLRKYIILPRRNTIYALLIRAQKRKQISRELNCDFAVDAIIGSVFARLNAGLPMDELWLKRAVRQLVNGWAKK